MTGPVWRDSGDRRHFADRAMPRWFKALRGEPETEWLLPDPEPEPEDPEHD